jgi:hypothetical protein
VVFQDWLFDVPSKGEGLCTGMKSDRIDAQYGKPRHLVECQLAPSENPFSAQYRFIFQGRVDGCQSGTFPQAQLLLAQQFCQIAPT